MTGDMGTFRTSIEIENPARPGPRRPLKGVLVAGTWTVDEVVFGERDDLVLLGARSLEGLNLRVEPVSKRLVDAGPAPAAAAA